MRYSPDFNLRIIIVPSGILISKEYANNTVAGSVKVFGNSKQENMLNPGAQASRLQKIAQRSEVLYLMTI
jgi:hypothetical protein